MRRFAHRRVLAAAALFVVATRRRIDTGSRRSADERLPSRCQSAEYCGDRDLCGLRQRLHARDGQCVHRPDARRVHDLEGTGERAGGRASTRATRASCSAARTTTAASTTAERSRAPSGRSGSATTARGQRRELHELARPGLPGRHVAVRGALAGSHRERRRPGDRLGQPRPRVLRLGELRRSGRLGEDVRRRLRRPLREPGRRRTPPTRPRTACAYHGTTVVAEGSSAPNLLGKFNDKTAIEADRTGGACDGNVYFSWSRFTGNGGVGIYFSRSTDHGVTFSSPMKLTPSIHDVQFPDISVTGNGHVYVTFRQFDDGGKDPNAVMIAKSTDCGADVLAAAARDAVHRERRAGPVGARADAAAAVAARRPDASATRPAARPARARLATAATSATHCASGFTFFRRDTQVRSTADQLDSRMSGSTSSTTRRSRAPRLPTGIDVPHDRAGRWAARPATFFVRYDGATGSHTTPVVIDNQASGHQVFPDISADGGVLHAIWWDSRIDPCYSVTRPIGNCANRTTVPSLDVFAREVDRPAAHTWTRGRRASRTSRRTRTTSSSTTAPCRSPATTSG